jgi:hypothetical protein
VAAWLAPWLLPAAAPVVPELAPVVPEYQVGDTAREDIVTPIELVAIDPVATADLRLKEAQKIPPAYRFDSNVLERVLGNLNQALTTNRDEFLSLLEKSFQKTRLGDREMARPAFGKAISSIRRWGRGFPLATNLAERWARRVPDDDIVGRYESALRTAMSRYIRADGSSAEEKIGGRTGCLILPMQVELTDLTGVESNGVAIAKTNVVALAKAKSELQQAFPEEERAVASFLAGLIRPNCVFDEPLTRQSRARRTEGLWSASRYALGSFVVCRGEVVTAKTKDALDRLRAELATVQPAEPAGVAGGRGWQTLAWVAGALGLVMAGGVLLWIGRRRQRPSLLPATLADGPAGAAGILASRPLSDSDRSVLMNLMADWLGRSFVRRLFRQRQDLLETQMVVAEHAVQLEQRLAVVQEQTENRFRDYEERIAQLEKELAAAEEDKRDLIQAKLVLARQEWEACKTEGRLTRN